MAKRRNLSVPSVDELRRMEEEFSKDPTTARVATPPIAQVAAEASASFDPRSPQLRAEAARDRADAEALRTARDRGLVLLELPVEAIDADALVRDRVVVDAEELEELKSSIAKNGLRLPVEVFLLESGGYGLLSGYRRLMAMRALYQLTAAPQYAQIKAVLRDPEKMGGSFAAMVEENEIRSSLSHYERGRIAVIAAQQGAFANTEAAVEGLFPMASKAKRSKIRSFALIFEELGDLLKFPDLIREKEGLKLAAALREGQEAKLRQEMARYEPTSPEEETAMFDALLTQSGPSRPDPSRGGRPRRDQLPERVLGSGYTLKAQEDGQGWFIRVSGNRTIDRELVNCLLDTLTSQLDRA